MHKDIISEEKAVALHVFVFITQEKRVDHRAVILRTAPELVIQIGDQPLAQVEERAHGVQLLLEEPGHVGTAIVVPGVEHKARRKQAVLDPAQEELRRGLLAREAANVLPEVVHAGEGQRHRHFVVIAEIGKARAVVARPGGGQTGAARDKAAGDRVFALAAVLRGKARAGHEVGKERLDALGAHGRAEAEGPDVLIRDLILVVIVPDAAVALFDKLPAHAVRPEGGGLRVREIQIAAHTAPERKKRALPLSVFEEPALRGDFLIERVLRQKAGLDVRQEFHPRLAEGAAQALGVRDLLPVPVEDEAFVADLRVAAREIETAGADTAIFAARKETAQLPLGVRRVGVSHGAAAVAQRPPGRQEIPPAEAGEACGDLLRRAEEDVVHQRLFLAAEGLEGAEIVVDLPAEVKGAVGIAVIVYPVGTGAITADIKWDMLVKRVAAAGVKAHGVARTETEAAAGLVHVPGLVSETEDLLARLAGEIMRAPPPELPAEVIGENLAILEQERLALIPAELKILPRDMQPKLSCREVCGVGALRHLRTDGLEALQAQALAPRLRHLPVRADREGREKPLPLAPERDADAAAQKIKPRVQIAAAKESGDAVKGAKFKSVVVFHFGSPMKVPRRSLPSGGRPIAVSSRRRISAPLPFSQRGLPPPLGLPVRQKAAR